MQMLERIMLHLHNWFELEIHRGKVVIQNGQIDLPFLQQGQYYRIVGSVFNDGLHRYGYSDQEIQDGVTECELQDEEFCGEIWSLAPPKAVLELASDIEAWVKANKKALDSPYTSENVIGVYSYTLKGSSQYGGSNAVNNGISWESQFRTRLNAWRKIAP